MKKENLEKELLELLKNFISENEINCEINIDVNSRLIGTSSIFDSLELVQFIVEVENYIEESNGIEVQLTSEKAMSRRTSPFISIATLSKFITEEIL